MRKPELPLDQQYTEFDRKNPHVWLAFCAIVEEMWTNQGIQKWTGQGVWELLRYEIYVKGIDQDPYRLNNNYVSFYTRRYAAEFPERKDFFKFRSMGWER